MSSRTSTDAHPGSGHERRRAGRFVGTSAAGLAVLVLGTAVFGVLLALVTLDSRALAVDRWIADRLNDVVAGDPVLIAVLERVTGLGGGPTVTVLLTTLTVALLVRRFYQAVIPDPLLGPIFEGMAVDWSVHIPADWPAKALLWMCSAEADAHLGEEISLRDEDIRKKVGLT